MQVAARKKIHRALLPMVAIERERHDVPVKRVSLTAGSCRLATPAKHDHRIDNAPRIGLYHLALVIAIGPDITVDSLSRQRVAF